MTTGTPMNTHLRHRRHLVCRGCPRKASISTSVIAGVLHELRRVRLPTATKGKVKLDKGKRLIGLRRRELVARREECLLTLEQAEEVDEPRTILASRIDGGVVRSIDSNFELSLPRLCRLQRLHGVFDILEPGQNDLLVIGEREIRRGARGAHL